MIQGELPLGLARDDLLLPAVLRPALRRLRYVDERKRKCGVYFLLLVPTGGEPSEIVYVGQSVDVESRIESHRAGTGRDSRDPIRFHAAVFIPVRVSRLTECEAAIIRALQPPENRNCPVGNPLRDREILLDLQISAEPGDLWKRGALSDAEKSRQVGVRARNAVWRAELTVRETERRDAAWRASL